MPNLSRRHLVTTAAALPALAVPAAAATLAYEPDPVFAAIDKWRTLAALHGAAIGAEDGYNGEDPDEIRRLDEIATAACHAECDAMRELCLTVPTTAAGASAVLRLLEGAHDAFKVFMDGEGSECGNRALMRSLRKATERWAAIEAVQS
jgi:hypothetical protein